MSLPVRAFEDLAVQITATGVRVDAALRAPSLSVSADMLLGLAHDMETLAAKVRQAANHADLQSRRAVTR